MKLSSRQGLRAGIVGVFLKTDEHVRFTVTERKVWLDHLRDAVAPLPQARML